LASANGQESRIERASALNLLFRGKGFPLIKYYRGPNNEPAHKDENRPDEIGYNLTYIHLTDFIFFI
jgi:hypothetical protein